MRRSTFRQEAHVEHLVRLVQDELGDAREIEVAAVEVIEEAPGGPHDDVAAFAQRVGLRVERHATVDGRDRQAALASDGQVVGDLHAQLARRCDHERLSGLQVAVDPMQQRQPEREGLAGPGAGLPDHVGALERHGQSQLLDGEGMDDVLLGQGVHE